jgi:hypothetical protein
MFVTKEILKEIQNKPDGGTHPAASWLASLTYLSGCPAILPAILATALHASCNQICHPRHTQRTMGTRRGTSMLASRWEGDASILPIIATARDMDPACRPVRPTQADTGV